MRNLKFLVVASLFLSLSSFSGEGPVEVQIGDLIISDRNVGAQQGGIALNYSDNEGHVDNKNVAFRGDDFNWNEALTACTNGWRLPTKSELELISNAMQFSDNRAYLEGVNGNRCYFPSFGQEYLHTEIDGGYWSSSDDYCYDVDSGEEVDSGTHLSVYMNYSSVGAFRGLKSYKMSVRCVKTAQ